MLSLINNPRCSSGHVCDDASFETEAECCTVFDGGVCSDPVDPNVKCYAVTSWWNPKKCEEVKCPNDGSFGYYNDVDNCCDSNFGPSGCLI